MWTRRLSLRYSANRRTGIAIERQSAVALGFLIGEIERPLSILHFDYDSKSCAACVA